MRDAFLSSVWAKGGEMLAKRIIPCLDVKNGETVKGVNFVDFRSAGDPVALGRAYSDAGADELVFLDITASHEGRSTFTSVVERVAREIDIPFTVGGGINTVGDVERLLSAGADKVSVNSAALKNPGLIDEVAKRYGSQVLVLAVDARLDYDGESDPWECYINGGRIPFGKRLYEWCREGADRGAGEILFTSMNHDGVKCGFALDPLHVLHTTLPIPVIASGGAGKKEHFKDVFEEAGVDAALAASIFHFNEVPLRGLKEYLREEGVNVRI